MGIVIRQSAINTLYIGLGFMLGGISTIFVFPAIFRNTPEDWGLIQILIYYSAILSQFLNLGVPNIAVKFLPEYSEKGRTADLAALVAWAPLLILSAFGLLLLVFPEAFLGLLNEEAALQLSDKLLIFFLILFSFTYFKSYSGLSTALRRTTLPTMLNEVFIRAFILLAIGAFFLEWIDFRQLLWCYGIGYSLQFLLMLLAVRKEAAFRAPRISRTERNSLFGYGLFSLLNNGAAMLINMMDVVMIAAFLPPQNVAFYTLGLYIANIVFVPSRALNVIATTLVSEAWHARDMKKIDELYYKSSITQLIMGLGIFILIVASLSDIALLLPPKYRGIEPLVIWLGLSKLVNMAAGINGSIIFTSAKYRVSFYLNLLLIVVAIVSNFILIPWLGIRGAAIATFVSLAIFNLLKFLYIVVQWKLSPFRLQHLYALVLAGAVFALSSVLPSLGFGPVADILYRSAVLGGLFAGLILGLRISEDMNIMMGKLTGQLGKWLGRK